MAQSKAARWRYLESHEKPKIGGDGISKDINQMHNNFGTTMDNHLQMKFLFLVTNATESWEEMLQIPPMRLFINSWLIDSTQKELGESGQDMKGP